jgi:ketosteroid isomerase-like protein
MPFSRAILCSVLLSTLVACHPGELPAIVDTAAEEAAIIALENEWSTMYRAGDLDAISEILAENTILLAAGEPPVLGAADVLAATEEMLSAEGVEVTWSSTAAFVAPSGEMAYDYGTATTTLPDGSTVEGQYLVVWIKEDGQWKVAADMFN